MFTVGMAGSVLDVHDLANEQHAAQLQHDARDDQSHAERVGCQQHHLCRVDEQHEHSKDRRKRCKHISGNSAERRLHANLAPDAEPFRAFLQRGFERREDYRASALGIGMRVERRKEIAASYAPRIVAQANHDWDNVTTNTSNTSGQRIWSGFVAVEVPFFTGGQREIDLHRAGLALEHARLDHETLTKEIEAEMLRGHADVETLRGSIVALEAEFASVQHNYEDLTTNYRAGAATSLDVSAALLDLNNARTNLLAARYDYQVALRNLERAEGVFQEDRVRSTRVK